MVLADGGVVCIDEFDKMRPEDRSEFSLHLRRSRLYPVTVKKLGLISICLALLMLVFLNRPFDRMIVNATLDNIFTRQVLSVLSL